MNIKKRETKPYFFNITGFGNLYLEHIIYECEDGEPSLFTCKDTDGIRFLCSCYKKSTDWIVGIIENSDLLKMLKSEITIMSAFKRCIRTSIINKGEYEYYRSIIIPQDAFPERSKKVDKRLPDIIEAIENEGK